MRTKPLSSILLLLILGLLLSSGAQADVVGRLTQVEGRVDILKGGQLPATPVKIDDGVQTGDVIRTKSLSKAQITFIDKTILTIAPESRIAIEEYMFDESKGKRNVVLQMFQGMALAVVSKIYQSEDPDFVIKTHTAVMGVRGTEFAIRLYPNMSTILNLKGRLQVANIFPEVGQLPRRAFKMAHSFGPPGSSNSVLLGPLTGTSVVINMTPFVPFTITQKGWDTFTQPVLGELISHKGGSYDSGSAHTSVVDQGTAGTGTGTPTLGSFLSDSMINNANSLGGTGVGGSTIIANTILPQPLQPVTGTTPNSGIQESIYSYTINKTLTGLYEMISSSKGQEGTFTGYLKLNKSIVAFNVIAVDNNPPGGFKNVNEGKIDWNLTGTVSGPAGTTGTVIATGVSSGGTKFVIPLTVTLTQNNKVIFPTGSVTGTSTVINPNDPGKDYKKNNVNASDGTATATFTKKSITPK